MNRRGLLLIVVGALLVGLLAACGIGSGKQPVVANKAGSGEPEVLPSARSLPTAALPKVERPNILVIEADDMRTDDLQFMPTVRSLIGGRGLTFTNSFAPYPLCCPSRASFLSGKFAHNHGVLATSDPFGFSSFDDRVTIATVLQKAGYQTALNGKYLNGYGKQKIKATGEPSLHYVPPGWDQWLAGLDKGFGPNSPYDGGTYRYFSMTQNVNGKTTAHPGVYSTYLLGRQTRRLITDFGKKQEPWFIWSTPVAPHFGAPREKDDPPKVRDDKGRLQDFKTPARPRWVKGFFDKVITHPLGEPAYGPVEADMRDKPRYLRYFPETNDAEKAALTTLSRQRAESLYVLDRQIAKTLVTLKKSGQWDDTVVAFTSDNGYFLGEHRKRQGKILAHEPSLRVPFLIAGPGIPKGTRYDPITTIDLAATWADLAGVEGGMPGTDGVSLVPTIQEGDRGWTTPVLTEGQMGDRPYFGNFTLPQFQTALNTKGIRTARWKFTKYSTGEVELYDLKNDPLELDSLQKDPAHQAILKRMTALWESYYDCRGVQACNAPLPKDLQASAQENQQITDQQYRQNASYYDHPFPERSLP